MITSSSVQIAGVPFTIVNPLSEEVMSKISEVVSLYVNSKNDEGEHDWDVVNNLLKYLGGGFCGRLFHLTDDLIIKFESGDYSKALDGEALHELQGLAHVPAVFMYNTEKQITVIQKIKGSNFRQYERGEADFSLIKFESERVIGSIKLTIEKMFHEKGWLPSDLHNENIMIDKEGNFWIVDFGCFERVRDRDLEDFKKGRIPYKSEQDKVMKTVGSFSYKTPAQKPAIRMKTISFGSLWSTDTGEALSSGFVDTDFLYF